METPDDPPLGKDPTHNHNKNEFKWQSLVDSAESCYCCGILLVGARAFFKRHNIKESELQHGSLRFMYPRTIEDVDWSPRKLMISQMEDGRTFDIETFTADDDTRLQPASWDYFSTFRRTL